MNGVVVWLRRVVRTTWFWSVVAYGLLTLLVLGPLLRPGYVFALDMVFTPAIRLPEQIGPSYPFYALLHVINFVVPADIIQKGILIAVLLLSGLGAHRMMLYVLRQSPTMAVFATRVCYVAGVPYMVNPFTFSRFLAGQFAVLLGYALLPWFVVSLMRFGQQPGMWRAVTLAAWLVAISIVSVHTMGVALVLAAVMGVQWLWILRHNFAQLANMFKWATLAAGITLVACSYWLMPLALGHGQVAAAVGSFDAADRQAFATAPGELGVALNVLAMQGFWAEATNLLILPQDVSDWWLLWAVLLAALAIMGGVQAYRRQPGVAILFFASGFVGWVLAMGSSGNALVPLNSFLATHLPFFGGYREPHKFAMLVVLLYVYCATFGAIAVQSRAQKIRGAKRYIFVICSMIVLIILPLANTRLMFWGFDGQLQTAQYPSDWSDMNDFLNRQPGKGKVLILPWHLYMRYEFANTVIASPAPKFFDRATVVNDNPELGPSSLAPSSSTVRGVDQLLSSNHNIPNPRFASELRQLDIQYILLAREADWHDYEYVAHQPGVRLVRQTTNLMLYRLQ